MRSEVQRESECERFALVLALVLTLVLTLVLGVLLVSQGSFQPFLRAITSRKVPRRMIDMILKN